MNTPIAYFAFNRPRHTRETFAVIRAQCPTKLFIITDGPRPGHATDDEQCKEVREIVEKIDWTCEVYRNYADRNLGLKRRVSSGLDWVFSQAERAIVIEDDCLPHPDFFIFCESLLERYESDERVWVITGNNFQNGRQQGDSSYYFSKYNHCWGWASWRRAWQHYRIDIPFWPEWKTLSDWLKKTPDKVEQSYWANIFECVRRNEIDSWAYPWTASVWYHGGLTATPNVNLVTNIGFGPDGTHTVLKEYQDGLSAHPLGPLTHPERVEQDKKADRYVFDHHFGGLQQRLHRRMLKRPRRIVVEIIRTFRN